MLLSVLLYLPTLGDGFLFDDRPLLLENEVVRSPHGIVELGRKSEAAARRGLRATRHGAADGRVTAELERLAR